MPPTSKYDYYVCPECGSEVRIGSKGCPHCEESEEELWSLKEAYLHNIPPEEFEEEQEFHSYSTMVRRPFRDVATQLPPIPERSNRLTLLLLAFGVVALTTGALLALL